MKKLNNIFLALFIIGFTISASAQCVDCSGSSANGETASAIGINSSADGKASFAGGIGSETLDNYSFAFGDAAKAWSRNGIALGKNVSVFGAYSFGLGENVQTTTTSAMVIGYGYDDDNPLVNSETRSLMIGFKSTKPTFFVGKAGSINSTGKIGIGDVTDPQAKLHIKADDGEYVDLLLEPGDSTKKAILKFGEISFNDSPNRIEAAQTGDLDFYTASDYVFRTGNVGMGIENPTEKLEVDGNIKQTAGFHILSDKIKATGANGLKLHDATGNGIVVKDNGKVGIGTGNSLLSSELEVDGTISTKYFRLDYNDPVGDPLTGYDGFVLQADEFGNASWADPMTLNIDDGDWELYGANAYRENGNVGIGTSEPESHLHINSSIGNTNATFFKVSNEGVYAGGTTTIGKIENNGPSFVQQAGNMAFGNDKYPSLAIIQKSFNGEIGLSIATYLKTDGSIDYPSIFAENSKLAIMSSEYIVFGMGLDKAENIYFMENGNVGIGVNVPNEKLEVAGNLKVYAKMSANEIEVMEMNNWEDEVFEENYDLATLGEVEGFIKENGHLPEIPSEAEVLENGYSIGEMDAMLLKKIEELTLYVIEQQKEIDELKGKQ